MEKGKFTIFLGSAAGVGKTYTMLSEGRVQLERGVDVKVGFIETHGREDTLEMIGALPVIPRRKIEYRDREFEEMDLDEIIRQHPQLVLIDELAHTDVPGSKNKKRYEDIGEILEHGIDVWSTVNIQHLESLNVLVYEMTGVKVRETFPDSILERADEIRLIDISPEALIERLKAGKVYPPGKIEAALSNFFQKSNLSALRELSLREVAEEVVEEITAEEALAARSIREKMMVSVGLDTDFQRIIRHGWRMAKRFGSEMFVVHVNATRGWLGGAIEDEEEDPEVLKALSDLTQTLGVELVRVKAGTIAEGIVSTARERKVSVVVMGKPSPSGGPARTRGRLVLQVLFKTSNVDLYLVGEEERESGGEGEA